jgi:methyltransferase (TIGR00027 family)
MKPGRFSQTAEFMALFRALESARPAEQRLFDDCLAATFTSPPLRRLARWSAVPALGPLLRRIIDKLWPGARTSGIARTRLIDDWVTQGIVAGCRQVVILGAGFDSRAWRLPALAGLPVFEVDHPTTALEKSRRAAAAGADVSRVISVTLDFDHDRFADRLAAAGFDRDRPTMVIWEGVTNYLTAEAVRAVLSWAGTLAAGSRLAFTYVHQAVLTDPARFEGAARILLAVAGTGEPWTFGFEPDALPVYLQGLGLRLVEDLGADAYRARYFGRTASKMRGYAFYRAALAVTGLHA